MNLRTYQQQGINAIWDAYGRGITRQLFVLATGGGKTVVAGHLCQQMQQRQGRTLFLAHRDILIQQAVEKIGRFVGPDKIGIVKAEQNRRLASCVIASQQTLAREQRLRQMPQYDCVIVDEAHRAAGKTYRRILAHVCRPDTLLLGITATPDRSDGLQLVGKVFAEEVFNVSLVELIQQGHLVDIECVNIGLPIEIEDIKTKQNDGIADLDQDALAVAMEASNWDECVTDGWLEHAHERRATLIFTPRVRMAYALAEYMRNRGIAAAAIDGSVTTGAQREIVRDFASGKLRVVINCDLYNEGADFPFVDCVVLAAPTKSRIRYCQRVGRGTRLSPETGKEDLLLLDFTGITRRLDLVNAAVLADARSIRKGESIRAAAERDQAERDQAAAEAEALRIEAEELQARNVELFGRAASPATVAQAPAKKPLFDWKVYRELKLATLHFHAHQFKVQRVVDEYIASEWEWSARQRAASFASYGEAVNWCEERAREFMLAPGAKWRSVPASEKQIQLLNRMRIPYTLPLTKGEAAALLDNRFNKRKAA